MVSGSPQQKRSSEGMPNLLSRPALLAALLMLPPASVTQGCGDERTTCNDDQGRELPKDSVIAEVAFKVPTPSTYSLDGEPEKQVTTPQQTLELLCGRSRMLRIFNAKDDEEILAWLRASTSGTRIHFSVDGDCSTKDQSPSRNIGLKIKPKGECLVTLGGIN